MSDVDVSPIVISQEVDYEGVGGKMHCTRLEGQWAAFFDTNDWCWEYIKGWHSPSFFKLRYVRITSPNLPEKTLINQTVFIYASGERDREKELAAETIAAVGGFALTVGSIPYGINTKELLKDLQRKTVWDIVDNYRSYWFHAPEKWEGKIASSARSLLWVDDDGRPVIGIWHSQEGRRDGNIEKTLEAFDHARQCRFEWGQNGYRDCLKED